jgi:SAM-dependent methyltransferase
MATTSFGASYDSRHHYKDIDPEIHDLANKSKYSEKNHGDRGYMNSPPHPYVHGRSGRESERLQFQASRLEDLLHQGTCYPPGAKVLEAACGVGAQTLILARNSPGANFVSVDIAPVSLEEARKRLREEGIFNVTFQQADVYDLPFDPESFDHVFVCFLLEHLPDPVLALENLRRVLAPGGTITVIEGDHGSAFFFPDSLHAHRVIGCLVEIQRKMGGNAMIGRELWHLLNDAGFSEVAISPRFVYANDGLPESVEGVENIFIAMIEGARDHAVSMGMIREDEWEKGIRDLYRTVESGGSFCYTFFKATAVK